MDAFARLRVQLNRIHSDLNMRGIQSKAIVDAAYCIETEARAYMEDVIVVDWHGLYKFTRTERRIAEALHRRLGVVVNWEVLLQSVYADRSHRYEELSDAQKVMQVLICKMRKQLKGSPYSIETDRGVGYRMVYTAPALALTALQELQAH